MRTFRGVLLLASAIFFGCGDSPSETSVGPPAQVRAVGATMLTGVFRQAVSITPSVQVTDARDRPVPGVSVAFTVQAGGGSVASANASTDADGNASPGAWILGAVFGPKTLTATVAALPPVTFTANAIAPDAGVPAFNLADVANDTMGSGGATDPKAHDLLSIRGDFKRDSLIVTLTFNGPVTPNATASPTAMTGFVEFDLDDNSTTGVIPLSNSYGGSAALGIDAALTLGSAGTTATVIRVGGSRSDVPAAFSGNTMIIRIPIAALNADDGNFGLVGVVGTPDRPTDVFPNTGSTSVRPTDGIAASTMAVVRSLQRAAGKPSISWAEAEIRLLR